ncbi:hypothetical protein L596_026462 [Steinernema carpocapsae]|uniref:Uncharacterized protein n=1 Tax=Steinernema carpocapsae TaxID=34508 RepID=A0A4U5M1I0_STECR|nr:hypothetical protein L596_026462 [Steinernema carpocapsae]
MEKPELKPEAELQTASQKLKEIHLSQPEKAEKRSPRKLKRSGRMRPSKRRSSSRRWAKKRSPRMTAARKRRRKRSRSSRA